MPLSLLDYCGKYKMQVVWNMIEIANLVMYIVVIGMLLYNYIVQWRLAEFDQSVQPPRLLALDVRRSSYYTLYSPFMHPLFHPL